MIVIPPSILHDINLNGENAYPEEGAGLLLGSVNSRHVDGEQRVVQAIFPIANSREDGARHNRYLIGPRDMMNGEDEAIRMGMDVIGVFHSHPDHPNSPSEFDREWALPWFSYLITSIHAAKAAGTRSWRLADDRSHFDEEELQIK